MQGAILPFGGHKGAAIGLMVELLAGPLIGELKSAEALAIDTRGGGLLRGGYLMLAINPAYFADAAGNVAGADAWLAALEQEHPAGRLPGTRRLSAWSRSRSLGVALPRALYGELTSALELHGGAVVWPARSAAGRSPCHARLHGVRHLSLLTALSHAVRPKGGVRGPMVGNIAFVELNAGTIKMVPMGNHEVDPRQEMASMICAAVEQGGVDFPYDPTFRIAAKRQAGFLLATVERDRHSIFAFGTAASDELADAGWSRMLALRTTRTIATERPAFPWSAACALDAEAFLETEWLPMLQMAVAAAWVDGYERMRLALDHYERTGLPSLLATQFEHSPPFGAVLKGCAAANGKQRRHPDHSSAQRAKATPRPRREPPKAQGFLPLFE